MRVAILCHPGLGGSSRVATRVAGALAAHGDEVHLLSTAEPASLPGDGVQLHVVSPPTHPVLQHVPVTLAMASALVQLVRDRRIDLIHAHFVVPWASSASIAAEALGVDAPAVVATLHGSDVYDLGPHPLYGPTTRLALERADAVTAVSHALRATAHADLDPTLPIEVIPNFVVSADCPRAEPAEPPWLVHVSNFRPVKRPLDVIEVFARVRARRKVRLRLVGDGPELERALSRAAELGVADDVHHDGPVGDATSRLRDVRVLLAPSERESFGLAPLEAQACGVPVVASAVDGLPEVIEHGETGFLHPAGDLEAMAASVGRLLDDDALHTRMAEASRARVARLFDRDATVARYREVYEAALEARGRTPSDAA